jgi:hypothetical protein
MLLSMATLYPLFSAMRQTLETSTYCPEVQYFYCSRIWGPVMLGTPPKEPEWLSWTYVVLGSLIIFCTVSVARRIQLFVANQLGSEFFLYTVGATLLVLCYSAISSIKRRGLPPSAYLWLIGVGASFIAYAYNLRRNPEEAIHLVQYGLLSVLVYRALIHRIQDHSVYIAATLVVGMIGMIDEWIQWIVPSRYWGLWWSSDSWAGVNQEKPFENVNVMVSLHGVRNETRRDDAQRRCPRRNHQKSRFLKPGHAT